MFSIYLYLLRMALIRSAYQDELDGVSQSLVDLTNMVTASVVKASKAVQSADLALAEEVIAADVRIDDFQHELDARIIDIIARQQPVASDLRALVTAMRMSADLENGRSSPPHRQGCTPSPSRPRYSRCLTFTFHRDGSCC